MPGTVVIVDVGQGDCTIVVDRDTKKGLLVDCSAGHYGTAISELEGLEFSELSAAIVTHSHLDHFEGVIETIEILKERFTGTLHYNHDSFISAHQHEDGWKYNKPKLIGLLRRAYSFQPRLQRAQPDIGTQELGTMTWTLLSPTHSQLTEAIIKGNPNLASAIMVIDIDGQSVVIGGDAPLKVWKAIQGQLPEHSIVRWPHHGGRIAGSHDDLFALLNPSDVLISVGSTNTYGHPSEDFFVAASGHGSRLRCTQATKKCDSGSEGGMCAGSIRIVFDTDREPQFHTSRPNHNNFIKHLDTPRCLD
ncbi:MAG: MBL fold metallo-hydrolase [Acidimicrobiia bacterium]|nr:MBL fold metallo-hydrolase [Acidimicrobiia bacterium]